MGMKEVRDSKQLAENIVLSTFAGWRDMRAKNIRRLKEKPSFNFVETEGKETAPLIYHSLINITDEGPYP